MEEGQLLGRYIRAWHPLEEDADIDRKAERETIIVDEVEFIAIQGR